MFEMPDFIHPSLLERKIIHVDMDAFYASVEVLKNPSLRHLPVIVGGSPDSRAVVCTANYVARTYGVHSGMACSRAVRLCPNGVFLPPDFSSYVYYSTEIRKIFLDYTQNVEPLSLDEAYLDVTGQTRFPYASQVGKEIAQRVFQTTGLTCSVGVAPNKLIAKIASDFKKPGGLTVIKPDNVVSFMKPLPVGKLFGIGKQGVQNLNSKGIFTCQDIQEMDFSDLQNRVKDQADWLRNSAFGIDLRTVESTYHRKSLGREETFAKDFEQPEQALPALQTMCEEIALTLKSKENRCRRTTLKLKFGDFQQITRTKRLVDETAVASDIYQSVAKLLSEVDCKGRKVRLVGVTVSEFAKPWIENSCLQI